MKEKFTGAICILTYRQPNSSASENLGSAILVNKDNITLLQSPPKHGKHDILNLSLTETGSYLLKKQVCKKNDNFLLILQCTLISSRASSTFCRYFSFLQSWPSCRKRRKTLLLKINMDPPDRNQISKKDSASKHYMLELNHYTISSSS